MAWSPASSIDSWSRDLRLAVRALRRTPGFTLLAAGTLGLAIGAAAAIHAVVDAVLLRPLPYADADRLVVIGATAPGSDYPAEFGVGTEFLLHYRERSQLLEEVSTANSFTNTLRMGDRAERLRMSWPTWTLLDTLGVQPVLGRKPTPADEDQVLVISHALWADWFHRDPGALGRTVEIGGAPRTVIGVMGPEFRFPNDGTLLWLSSVPSAEELRPGRLGPKLVGRLTPDATPEALAAELTALARELPARYGGDANYAKLIEQHRAVVRPLREELLGDYRRPLGILAAAVAIVLLVACANVANLFLVRAEGRQRDLALRRAIGAGRGQLVRLQLAEAAVVAALAAALALAVAAILMPLVRRFAPGDVPRLDLAGIGGPTLLVTLAVALGAALACGTLPALRSSLADFARLREGGRGASAGRLLARHLLVAGQTALALVLLVGSGLLVRSFLELRRVDPGYRTDDLFTFQIAPELPESEVVADDYARFALGFLDRLAALPGVASVGLVENVPLNESTSTEKMWAEGDETGEGTLLHLTFTAGDYFRTMGIELEEGRLLGRDDQLSHQPQAIVSRSAANLLFGAGSPLGKRFKGPEELPWTTVVGVVEDVRQDNFRDAPEAVVYLPLTGTTQEAWAITSPAYVLRTPRAATIAPEVRALVREVAPGAPMYRTFTMAGLARDSMQDLAFMLGLLASAAGLALLLGTVGLFGVLSYVVAQRGREIGIRMALGAQTRAIRRMVVRQGARVVGAGLAVGLAVAALATRSLGGLLFGVPALDPPTFLATSTAMLGVGLLASWLPALRAARVDPAVTLRAE